MSEKPAPLGVIPEVAISTQEQDGSYTTLAFRLEPEYVNVRIKGASGGWSIDIPHAEMGGFLMACLSMLTGTGTGIEA